MPFLYLPAHCTSSSDPERPRDFLGVHIGRQELLGNPGSLTELVRTLSTLNFEQVMGWITFIGTLFGYGHRHSYQEQLNIAQQVLNEELLRELQTRWKDITKRQEVVFHRQQLWVVVQLAAMCCSDEVFDSANEKNDIKTIGECLLIANDVVGNQFTRKFRENRDPQSPEWFMSASFLSMIELNWQATGPVAPSRAISIWTEILPQAINQEAIDRLLAGKSPDDSFQEMCGVSLSRYLDFVATLHFLFDEQNKKKNPLLIQRDVLAHLGDPDYIDRCLNLISRTPEQLASDLIFHARQSWAVDFSPLRQHPVIRLKNDRFVCPDLQLLEYYFDDAFFWKVVASYPSESNIQQFYGELFEQHMNNVIKAFVDPSPMLAKRFFPQPKFEGTEDQVSDAVIDLAQVFPLVEYKSTRLTRYQKYSGDTDALLKGFDDAFARSKHGKAKGVNQLARSIKRVLEGAKIPGISQVGTRPVLPILIITEPGLTNELFRRRLDDKLQSAIPEGLRTRVLPLILLSHFDVEAFETYVGKSSAEEILHSYAISLRSKTTNLLDSFGSYVARNHDNATPDVPIYMQNLRTEQLHEIATRLGIPADANYPSEG